MLRKAVELAGFCIKCGFCEPVCPTIPAFKNSPVYGPRGRILLLREIYRGEFPLNERIRDPYYSCLNCKACYEVCPAEVDVGEISSEMKKLIQLKGLAHALSYVVRDVFQLYGNPLGVKVSNNEISEILPRRGKYTLFTGQLYQLMGYADRISSILDLLRDHPSLLNVSTRSELSSIFLKFKGASHAFIESILCISKLLRGRDVAYDPSADFYSGIFLYDLGFEEVFSEHAKKVFNELKERGITKVVTIDPHTTYALLSLYPRYVEGFDIDVTYYLELLDDLNLKVVGEISVAYQEPCYLVRHLRLSDIRSILESVKGLSLEKVRTSCCGGPIEYLYPERSRAIAKTRATELSAGEKDLFITACPVCMNNFRKIALDPLDISLFIYRNLS